MNDEQHDEVIYDDENPEMSAKGSVKKLREKLKDAEEKSREYLTGWQKAKADLVNLRKEDEKRLGERVKYAEEALILDLLPVIDSFEMAFANKEAWEALPKEWRVGVEYIHNGLLSTLGKYGAKILDPVGEDFNPETQEAVETVPVVDESRNGKVVQVIQKGFMMHDKIIRTVKVKVGEFKN